MDLASPWSDEGFWSLFNNQSNNSLQCSGDPFRPSCFMEQSEVSFRAYHIGS